MDIQMSKYLRGSFKKDSLWHLVGIKVESWVCLALGEEKTMFVWIQLSHVDISN